MAYIDFNALMERARMRFKCNLETADWLEGYVDAIQAIQSEGGSGQLANTSTARIDLQIHRSTPE